MKKIIFSVFVISIFSCALFAEDNLKKVALGDVVTGSDMYGQDSYETKETIQIGIKKELEKIGKGKYNVEITSSSVVVEGKEPETSDFPELPEDRAPTQAEISKYMARMQQWQKQMTGEVKVFKPVDANAYFEFKIISGQSGMDTGMAAGLVGDVTGKDASMGDMSTNTTKIQLITTMRNPKTGALIDKYTAKAQKVKYRNVGGFTSYDYGTDETEREKLFKSAIKETAKWINMKLKDN